MMRHDCAMGDCQVIAHRAIRYARRHEGLTSAEIAEALGLETGQRNAVQQGLGRAALEGYVVKRRPIDASRVNGGGGDNDATWYPTRKRWHCGAPQPLVAARQREYVRNRRQWHPTIRCALRAAMALLLVADGVAMSRAAREVRLHVDTVTKFVRAAGLPVRRPGFPADAWSKRGPRRRRRFGELVELAP